MRQLDQVVGSLKAGGMRQLDQVVGSLIAGGMRQLDQVVLLQVELQDIVLDGSKHKADVLRVRGAGEVRVDDLIAVWVQVHKHL